MTSRFKKIALAALREARHFVPTADMLECWTEQEGWTMAVDMAAKEDNTRYAMFAASLFRPQVKPVKEVKVYSGPGYPIDPEREARRRSSSFLWNPL